MSLTEAEPGTTIWNEQQPFILKKARDLARSFNFVVEEEDLLQEAWVFCWEKEEQFLLNNCRDVYVRKSIENVMVNFAKKMRDQKYKGSDEFDYSADEVRELLPKFLTAPNTLAMVTLKEHKSMDGEDSLETFADFTRAWDRLNAKQQDILERRYIETEDFSEDKDRKALSRAVKRLVEILNQNKSADKVAHQGPGSRKAMTNAAGLSAVRTHEG